MSPLDMLIFLFFILVTIKAVSSCIDYWRDREEEAAVYSAPKINRTTVTRTVTTRTVRPSSVRVTPIKRADIPAAATSVKFNNTQQILLKDKGAA